jgi:hypothetical protein
MSRAKPPQAAPQPPSPLAGYLWSGIAALAFGLIATWFPVHAVGALLRLSFAVQDAAERGPPAVRAILLVNNAADAAVSNLATEEIGTAWARNGGTVRSFTFPADMGLNHDLIDVNNPSQRVELVYPTLIGLIEEAR